MISDFDLLDLRDFLTELRDHHDYEDVPRLERHIKIIEEELDRRGAT